MAPELVAFIWPDLCELRSAGLSPASAGLFRARGVLPGTELAFDAELQSARIGLFGWKVKTIEHTTAIFRQINKSEPRTHHDALEFPDGHIERLTDLSEGQTATVLQLPAQPATPAEAQAQERVAYVG